jgi:hypothetical protein
VTLPARFLRIARNPSLYPGVPAALGPDFPWHTHAGSPRSSQALCLSAWAPLASLDDRHEVIDRFLAGCLPAACGGTTAGLAGSGRRWQVRLEVSDADVLGERGGHASAVDVVLEADDAVVCVESKYLRDAVAGFRGCGQFPAACRGYHGPGSDRTGLTQGPCRLAVRDGRREARRYWDVAAGLFRPEALAPGPGEPGSCALHRQYQLARTLLYAKATAGEPDAPAAQGGSAAAKVAPARGRRRFAALVLAPAATAGLLERQTAAFAADVLPPEHAGRVAVAHYEGLVRLLLACGDPEAAAVGEFIAALLPPAPAPARTQTARELRRRAEAERRRRPGTRGTAHANDATRTEDAGAEPRTMGR